MRLAIAAVAGLLLGAGTPAASAQAGSLTDDVQRLIASKRLGQARVGVVIVDAQTGARLAAVNPNEAFIPASNQKVLTSAAALSVLGPEFVFRTELVLVGDTLVVRGSGDPALADPELLSAMKPAMSVEDLVGRLARAARDKGVTSLRELVVDDRVFDREFVHPSWPVEQLHNAFAAPVSGVNFHGNALSVYMRPSRDGIGRAPTLRTEPRAPWIRIENRARTVAQGRNTAWLNRAMGTNDITLVGEIRTEGSAQVTIDGPGLLFGRVLADQLWREGVPVGASASGVGEPPAAVRLVTPDEPQAAGRVVAVVNTPLAEILRRCNTDSDNLYAESLLKKLSHAVTNEPGSWENGASVLRMSITEKLGAEAAASTVIADGSGLSRLNRVSPATLVRWIQVVSADARLGEPFLQSLARPGVGTFRRRFQETKLRNEFHGKSGFIRGVRTLSGVLVEPATGRRVIVAVFVNDIRGDEPDLNARQLAEDIVQRADRWLTARAPDTAVGG